MSAEKKPPDSWLALVFRALLLGLFAWMVRTLVVPIVLGALVALILYPIQRRLTPRLGKAAPFAPAILTTGAVLLGVLPLVLFGLKAIGTVNAFMAKDWNQTITEVQRFVSERTSGIVERFHLNTESLGSSVENFAKNTGSKMAGWLGTIVTGVPQQIVDAFLFLIALYFFLRDGRALTRWMLKLSPFPWKDTEELFSSIHDTVNGVVLGVVATAAVQGALTMGSLYIFGVPGAFLLGILATVLAVLPMVGTTPVTVGATIYLFASGKIGLGIGMAIATVVIGFSDNIVRPWVQSSRSTMHPLLALISIFGGLDAFGAVGIFIGPVIAAMALWIVDTYADLRAKQRLRQGAATATADPAISTAEPSGGAERPSSG